MIKKKSRWLAIALSAAMTVTAVPVGGIQAQAETGTEIDENNIPAAEESAAGTETPAEDGAPQTEDATAETENTAPQTEDAEPQTEDEAPQTENTAPQTEEATTQTDDEASQSGATSSQSDEPIAPGEEPTSNNENNSGNTDAEADNNTAADENNTVADGNNSTEATDSTENENTTEKINDTETTDTTKFTSNSVEDTTTRETTDTDNADPELILHMSFDETISDDAGKGATVTAYSNDSVDENYSVTSEEKIIGTGALKLEKNSRQWLDVKNSEGKNLLAGKDKITVNYFSKTNYNTTSNWSFFAAPSDAQQAWMNEKYLGVLDTKKGDNVIDVERYFSNNIGRPETTWTPYSENDWKMVTVVADESTVTVYVNGEARKTTESAVNLSDIFAEDGILQIGKGNWNGGQYSDLFLDEYSVYDGALDADAVKNIYESYKNMFAEPEETPGEEDPGVDETGDSNLVLHFTFDSEEKGFSGRGAKAVSNGGYELVANGENEGVGKKAIRLRSEQWLDVKTTEGDKNVLSGLDTVTINFFSNAFSTSTSWALYAAPNANSQNSGYEKYFGITDPLWGSSIVAERYYLENQGRPSNASTSKVNGWKMVTVVADKTCTKIFINGMLKSVVDSDVPLDKIFGGDDGILQIGKANWGSGEYSDMLMDDLAVFNRALTEEEISELYKSRDVEAVEYKESSEEVEEEKEPEKDLGTRATDVVATYEEKVSLTPGQDYSLLDNTGAKITFNNGTTKEDAVISWYDKDGNRILNTKDLTAGNYELTGKLSYFGSPVVNQKADPYVIYNEADGYYYMTSSWPAYKDAEHGYDRIALRRNTTLAGLSEAEDVTIWNRHEGGELSHHIWAPELHKIGSDWYVYFAGTCSSNVWDIKPYVLHCTDSSDLLNPAKWEEKGRFVNKDGGYEGAFDAFTLDMTMFTSGDKSYVIWAYKNGASVLKMAELNTDEPWKLASDPIVISEPVYSWEMNGDERINEGPAVLKKDGKIYVAFSGSTTGPEYCMGLLTADENSDLMDPISWKKSRYAALQTEDLVGQYGPGHNSFTTDKDGNIIVVYHARDEKCYRNECDWGNEDPLYDPCRNAHMAILRFAEDGRPVFTSTENLEMEDLSEEQKTFKMTVSIGSAMEQLEADAAALTIPNANDIRGNITLPEEGLNGSEIIWKSSAPEIISDEDAGNIRKGVVNRTENDEKVTLTATFKIGEETLEKDFEVTVKAKAGSKKLTHYLFAYFTGESSANGEQIYFADSKDGLNWSALNLGEPVITSGLGEKGLRDPFIIRAPEGDKFYLIATDLKINGNGNWGNAQTKGSKSIMVWESTDLVNWGEQRMVKVADEAAGCTWAPEAFYDEETGEYIVFWASMIDNYHKVWYATTRDFYTFSEPKVWIHLRNKNGKNISVIDTSVIAVDNADGTKTYYRISKDEAGSDASVDEGDPASGKFEILETATSLTGEWTRIPSTFLNENQWVEGGTIFKFNDKNEWCMLLDNFGGGGYYPCITSDIGSGEFKRLGKDEYSFPSTMRHGTVIGITDEEYKALEKKWAYDDSDETYDTSLEEATIAHFTFDDEETGLTGCGAVATPGESGYEEVERGSGKAVKLNKKNKQYLTLTKEDGTSLLEGLPEFAVNYWSNTEVKNETQWLFYAAEDDKGPSNNYERYLGIIDPLTNDTLLHVERYKNNGGRSTNNVANIGKYSNEWKMVTVVFFKDATKLYVNGELISVVKSSYSLTDILGKAGVVQIGKANWGGGEYTNAMVDDYSIFNRTISSSEIKALYEEELKHGEAVHEKPSDEEPGNENPSGEEPATEKPSSEEPVNENPANVEPGTNVTPSQGTSDKPETKPETKPSANTETKPSGNTEDKPETKPSGNSEVTSETQPTKNEVVTPEETTPAVSTPDNNTVKNDSTVKEEQTVVTGTIKMIKKGRNKGRYQAILADGSTATGLINLNGKAYYFNSKGVAKKGFHKVNGKKIYTNSKGKIITGFKMIKGKIYYFDSTGAMKTGKVKIGKLVYYFGKNGKLKKIRFA